MQKLLILYIDVFGWFEKKAFVNAESWFHVIAFRLSSKYIPQSTDMSLYGVEGVVDTGHFFKQARPNAQRCLLPVSFPVDLLLL